MRRPKMEVECMISQGFVQYHLVEALLGGVADVEGNDALSRRLRAEVKLRLISMSDEELWELAKLTASPPEKPVELLYKEHKHAIEDIRSTASEWKNDLQISKASNGEREMPNRVLIIESEPSVSKEIASTLSEAGFSVALASDYPEAMLKLDEFMPNMIIVGEVFPDRDGIEVCSQLRSTFSAPIILLGRDSSGKGWMKAVEAGADFYLRKPFSDLVLVTRVKAMLRRYKGVTR